MKATVEVKKQFSVRMDDRMLGVIDALGSEGRDPRSGPTEDVRDVLPTRAAAQALESAWWANRRARRGGL